MHSFSSPADEVAVAEQALLDKAQTGKQGERRGIALDDPGLDPSQTEETDRPSHNLPDGSSAVTTTAVFGVPDADAHLGEPVAPIDPVDRTLPN